MLFVILLVILIAMVIVNIVNKPSEMLISRSSVCCITVSAIALIYDLIYKFFPVLGAMVLPTVLMIPVPNIAQLLFYSVNILRGILIIKTSMKREGLMITAITAFIDLFFVIFNLCKYPSIVSVLLFVAIFSCLAGAIKGLRAIRKG